MSPIDQKALCIKIAECLKANDLASVNVVIFREEVCKLSSYGVEGRCSLNVVKELSISKAENVAKFGIDI